MKSSRALESAVAIGSLVGAAAFAGCGRLAEFGASEKDGGSSSSTGSRPTDGGGGDGGRGKVLANGLPPAIGATPQAQSSGTMVMRRLTNTEYDNIMTHLLGDTTQPAASFPIDPITPSGYDAPSSVAELNVMNYYQTSLPLVETAIASGTAPGNQLVVPTMTGVAGATQFIQSFGLLAYRRPVEAEELSDLLTIVFSPSIAEGESFSTAIGYVAVAMLNSPNFLYHWEIGPTEPTVGSAGTGGAIAGLVPLTPWQLASRLSMTLWADMPDAPLLQAAESGGLSTTAGIAAQVTRMYADPRFSQALYDLNLQWILQPAGNVTVLNQVAHTSPLWSNGAANSLEGEFTSFLTAVYTGDGTYNALMTAPYAFIDSALAPIYGVSAPSGTGFSQVQLNPAQRAGILTQTAFLASQADATRDDPFLRGLSVYENMLCGGLNPSPNLMPPLSMTLGAVTTRDLFADAVVPSPCQECHAIFDPPGFAFENYDAVGAYRTTDNGSPVDATGSFITPGGCKAGDPCGTTITFKNAVDLSTQLAALPEAQWCAERQWYRYAAGRLESIAEAGSLQVAYQAGARTPGFSLRESMAALLSSVAFSYRTPSPGEMLP